MAEIDSEKERQRLERRFAGMSDGELQKVGRDPLALMDWAFEALSGEMKRRDLEWAGKNKSLTMIRAEAGKLLRKSPAPDEEDGDAPVILRRYWDIAESLADRMALDSAGIESYLYDENLVRMDWFISNGIGGIKLVVRKSDAADAVKILDGKPTDEPQDGADI
jgi:hypothetical protein